MPKYKVTFRFDDTEVFEVEAPNKKEAEAIVIEEIDCCRDGGGHLRNASEYGFVSSVKRVLKPKRKPDKAR